VAITEPTPEASGWAYIYEGDPITAAASDNVGVASVTFQKVDEGGSYSLGTVTTPPYTVYWPCVYGFYEVTATAVDVCGNSATSDPIDVYGYCGASMPNASLASLRWTSQLDVPQARGQVVLNGGSLASAQRGRSEGQGELRRGENRIEAQLVEASGQPGNWKFDLTRTAGLLPGSLKVVSGQLLEVSGSAITFRLSGKVGERVAFTFRVGQ
jgi:hypothetical protein